MTRAYTTAELDRIYKCYEERSNRGMNGYRTTLDGLTQSAVLGSIDPAELEAETNERCQAYDQRQRIAQEAQINGMRRGEELLERNRRNRKWYQKLRPSHWLYKE